MDATASPAVISPARAATLALLGFTASLTVAYSSECAAAGNAVAGWVELDIPGVVTARVRGAGVHHCTAIAPFRHRLLAAVGGSVTMAGGRLHLSGLGGAPDCCAE